MPSQRKRKLQLTLQAPPARNPLVAAALLRKAGSHRKSAAAERRADKVALTKQLRSARQANDE